MGRAVIVINRYPPSPNEVAGILEELPPRWRFTRMEEDAPRNRTRLVIEGENLPDQAGEFESATALLQAVSGE